MKKTALLLGIVFLALAMTLTACGGDMEEENGQSSPPEDGDNGEDQDEDNGEENGDKGTDEDEDGDEEKVSSYDYYPFKENVRLHYDGEGMEFVEERVHFDYIQENRAQIRRESAGTTLLEVIHHEDGKVYSVLSEGESYQKESFYDEETLGLENAEILIHEPIEVGTEWEIPDGARREITEVGMEMSTPAGDFEVIEITTTGEDYTSIIYYGEGIGKVRTETAAEETDVFSELVEVEEGYEFTDEIAFYYPDFNEDRLVYIEEEITFATNDAVEDVFQEYFRRSPKENSDDYVPLMSDNTEVNYVRMGREEFVGQIDFSEEFITEMNAGTTLESMILSSVARTVGDYFRVEEVQITIDGENYASGHYEFREGETLENNPGDDEEKIEKEWEE